MGMLLLLSGAILCTNAADCPELIKLANQHYRFRRILQHFQQNPKSNQNWLDHKIFICYRSVSDGWKTRKYPRIIIVDKDAEKAWKYELNCYKKLELSNLALHGKCPPGLKKTSGSDSDQHGCYHVGDEDVEVKVRPRSRWSGSGTKITIVSGCKADGYRIDKSTRYRYCLEENIGPIPDTQIRRPRYIKRFADLQSPNANSDNRIFDFGEQGHIYAGCKEYQWGDSGHYHTYLRPEEWAETVGIRYCWTDERRREVEDLHDKAFAGHCKRFKNNNRL